MAYNKVSNRVLCLEERLFNRKMLVSYLQLKIFLLKYQNQMEISIDLEICQKTENSKLEKL